MREVRFLNDADLPGLGDLVRPRNDAIARNLPYFIQQNMVIGCVRFGDNVIEQALVPFLRDKTLITSAFSIGGLYKDMFDMLCATCSSATPVISDHVVMYQPALKVTAPAAWDASRLGKYGAPRKPLTHAELVDVMGGMLVMIPPDALSFRCEVRYPYE